MGKKSEYKIFSNPVGGEGSYHYFKAKSLKYKYSLTWSIKTKMQSTKFLSGRKLNFMQ